MTGPENQKTLAKLLLSWYDSHRCDLPWRRTRNPYAIWIAEVMLQLRAQRKPLPHHHIGVGVIWKGGRILIARRPLDGLLGGLWEFPGGKREPDETLEDCVVREVREELGIQIEVQNPLLTINHAYTHFKVTLHVFNCEHRRGEPQALGCDDWRWVAIEELDDYAFPTANHHIIAALQSMSHPLE